MTVINLKKGSNINLSKEDPSLNRIIVGLSWDANEQDTGDDYDLDAAAFLLAKNGKVIKQSNFVFYNRPTNHPTKDGKLPLPDGTSAGRPEDLSSADMALVSVYSSGDNRTGSGEGDDEQVKVDLKRIPTDVDRIMFTVTIDAWAERKQNFGQVPRSAIRIVNEDKLDAYNAAYNARNKEALAAGVTPAEKYDEHAGEFARFDLQEDFSTETAVIFAELYRHPNGQKDALGVDMTDWKFRAIGQGYNNGLAALVDAYITV